MNLQADWLRPCTMRYVALCLALLSHTTMSLATEIQLKFIRPSQVIGMLATGEIHSSSNSKGLVRLGSMEGSGRGILPKGVKLSAQDSKGILRIDGTDEQVAVVRRFIELFDVRPAKVSVELEFTCPVLNHTSKTSTTIPNNRPWSITDGTTDIQLSVTPRVNDDGTVTFFMGVHRSENVQSVVIRLKGDQAAFLRLGDTVEYKTGGGETVAIWPLSVDIGAHALAEPISTLKLKFKLIPGEPVNDGYPEHKKK